MVREVDLSKEKLSEIPEMDLSKETVSNIPEMDLSNIKPENKSILDYISSAGKNIALNTPSILSNLPGAPIISGEFKEKTEGMNLPQKLGFSLKESGIKASKLLPFFIAPELGAIKAGLVNAGASSVENTLKGKSPMDIIKNASIAGLLGGSLQKGFQLLPGVAKQAVGFAGGYKLPIAERVIEKPDLLKNVGETGYSEFAKDYAKTLKGLETSAGESTKAIKESIPKETIIDLKEPIINISEKYGNKTDLKGIEEDLMRFADNQHSTINKKIIKNIFNVNKSKSLNYDEAQQLRDLLGDFTKFGENEGRPKEIAEQLRKGLGNKIDSIDERYMPAQETYAKTLDLIERARRSAGIPENAVNFANKEGRPGVFELPPEFSESGLRTLGNELLLASGKKEPQANILSLVEQRSGVPLQDRLKDITTRTAVQEAKERPIGLLSLMGALGAGSAGFTHQPEIAGALGIPILARTLIQKNPELLSYIIKGAKSTKPIAKKVPNLTQGILQNILRGGEK